MKGPRITCPHCPQRLQKKFAAFHAACHERKAAHQCPHCSWSSAWRQDLDFHSRLHEPQGGGSAVARAFRRPYADTSGILHRIALARPRPAK